VQEEDSGGKRRKAATAFSGEIWERNQSWRDGRQVRVEGALQLSALFPRASLFLLLLLVWLFFFLLKLRHSLHCGQGNLKVRRSCLEDGHPTIV
jgi:hypothetical protein